MANQQRWWIAAALAIVLSGVMPANADDSSKDKCSAKLEEIDAAIELARKEGSMRKVATLKDLRVEALRCSNKTKPD